MTMQSFSFCPGFSFPLWLLFIFPFLGDTTSIGVPPLAAARIAANRTLARSSPESAAFTYQTLASRGSRRVPIPISVKYPTAYSALVRPGDMSVLTLFGFQKILLTTFSGLARPFICLVLIFLKNGFCANHVPRTQSHHSGWMSPGSCTRVEMNTQSRITRA